MIRQLCIYLYIYLFLLIYSQSVRNERDYIGDIISDREIGGDMTESLGYNYETIVVFDSR